MTAMCRFLLHPIRSIKKYRQLRWDEEHSGSHYAGTPWKELDKDG